MPISKLRPSFTFTEDRLKELQAVVPEAFADGRINWDTLREALGEKVEDETKEHFGLFWPGKREARRLGALPSKGTLIPQPGAGVDEENTHNLFIEGDNLEVLKLLKKSYVGLVKMIYIDPPYNTGGDLLYFDNFSMPTEKYLGLTDLVDEKGIVLTSNSKSDGRFHSSWLNMMYPRLVLARELLTENGVIFVSIDDNESHNLRQLLNELFGEENFVADIVAVNNLKGRNDKAHIATAHERLLIFKRPAFVEVGLELTVKQKENYGLTDNDGYRYRLLGLRKRGGADTRDRRPKLFFPIYINPQSGSVSLASDTNHSIEVLPRKSDGTDGCWRWGTQKVPREASSLLGVLKATGAWDVFEVDYLDKGELGKRMKPKSVWFGSDFSTDSATKEFKKLMGDCGFPNPKSIPLITDLIKYATKDDDLVLDFFAGSCTTAHAVFSANNQDEHTRRFIMIQLPEVTQPDSQARRAGYKLISEIGVERIRRAIKQIKQDRKSRLMETRGDIGFRSYRFTNSNFTPWDNYCGRDTQELASLFDKCESPLIENWGHENLLTEILLLQGFPLDSRVRSLPEFKVNKVQQVTSEFVGHHLYICLDNTVKAETVAKINLSPEDILVCLDSALSDEAKVKLADQCNLRVI